MEEPMESNEIEARRKLADRPTEDASRWASETWKQLRASGLLEEADTAVIFYSTTRLRQRLDRLRTLFEDFECLHTVAIKTNPQTDILEEIVRSGIGLEAASFEEVQLAVAAGAPFDRITYNSPVKTRQEIAFCEAHYPGLRLNANSLEELSRIPEATRLQIGLRINPLVQAGSQELYNVSGEESKFGVPIDQRQDIIDHALRYGIQTLHVHVGSQVGNVEKVVDAVAAVVELAEAIDRAARAAVSPESPKPNSSSDPQGLQNRGEEGNRLIKSINIGGGMPAGKDPTSSHQIMAQYVSGIKTRIPAFQSGTYQLITEFGQWVHKHNGLVFSHVEYVKKLNHKSIAYVHVGADLFLREAYTGQQSLAFVCLDAEGDPVRAAPERMDIAGPLCFNGDYLGKDQQLPALKPDDIIAIPSTGANAYGLWSRHCSRAIPAIFLDAHPAAGGNSRQTGVDLRKVANRSLW